MTEKISAELQQRIARTGPLRVGPALRQAYDRFIVSDQTEEIAANLHRDFPADFMARVWDVWRTPSFTEFLAWVHELRAHQSVRDIAAVTGSFTAGLRVIRHLAECDLVEVSADGALAWRLELEAPSHGPGLTEVQRLLEELLSPVKVGSFGQCAVNPASSVRRGLKVARDVTHQTAEVIFLGDADLASIVTAARLPGRVAAIDADPVALNRLSEAQRRLGLKNLEVVNHDLASPLPDRLRSRFASAVIDPIDNGWGLDLWLTRVFEALNGLAGDKCYISIDSQRIGRRLVALQEFMARAGYAVVEIIRNFHDWPLPNDPSDPHTAMLPGSVSAAGISESVLAETVIYTDLIVFQRRISQCRFMPQDHIDIRRGI